MDAAVNPIDTIIQRVIARESAQFTNNPADSGGPTKYGITQASLSRYLGRPALVADVQMLDAQAARDFYFWMQVHEPEFDAIEAINAAIAAELIDTGTLCGPARAAIFLQRALNAMNNQGTLYADVAVDGDAGFKTREALRLYLAARGQEGAAVMVAALNAQLGAFLIELATARPKDETFCYGWLKARVLEAA